MSTGTATAGILIGANKLAADDRVVSGSWPLPISGGQDLQVFKRGCRQA